MSGMATEYSKTSNYRDSGTPGERGAKFPKQGHRQYGDAGKRRKTQGGERRGGRKLSGRFHDISVLRKKSARQAYGFEEKKVWFNRTRPMIETKTMDSRTVFRDVATEGDPNQKFVRNPDDDQIGYTVPDDNGLLVYSVPVVYHIQLTPFWFAPSRRKNVTSHSTVGNRRSGFDQLTGNTRFITHMRTKIRITMPKQYFRPFLGPRRDPWTSHTYWTTKMYIVHGWIKDAPNWADRGDFSSNSRRPWPASIPQDKQAWRRDFLDYTNWIRSQVNEWFEENKDPLRFNSKRKSRLKILGYFDLDKLQTKDLNYNSMIDRRGVSVIGSQAAETGPVINYTADFGEIYRKVHYTHGMSEAPSNPGLSRVAFNFPNSSTWTPFCVVYTPDAALWTTSLDGGNAIIQCEHNTQMWYHEG